jgi:hypothetical protein
MMVDNEDQVIFLELRGTASSRTVCMRHADSGGKQAQAQYSATRTSAGHCHDRTRVHLLDCGFHVLLLEWYE